MPDFGAQFRSPKRARTAYMGGTAVSCGEHTSLPKRHRWSAWRVYLMPNPDFIGRERYCLTCALCSDVETKRYRGGPIAWQTPEAEIVRGEKL